MREIHANPPTFERIQTSVRPGRTAKAGIQAGRAAGSRKNPDGDTLELTGKQAPGNASPSWGDVRRLTDAVRGELHRRLMDLHRNSLRGADPHDSKNVTPVDVSGEAEIDAPWGIDPYWNAENTAGRIAEFAMGFAGLHGGDPKGLAAVILEAVEEGFRQAHALTGDLPGRAGDLNRDTHALTFKKLEERLDAWKASLYNEPAPAAAGATAG